MKTAAVFVFLVLATVGSARYAPQHVMDAGKIQGIINGEEAEPGQFPYMAAIQRFTMGGLIMFCAGVLVDPQWVALSGRCANYDPSFFTVNLGIHDLRFPEEGGQTETYSVVTSVVHPNYDGPSGLHSIALWQLAEPANLENPFIELATLAPDNDDDYLDAECVITGWKLQGGPLDPADPLKFGQTRVQTAEYCNALTREGFINPTDICAFNAVTTSCGTNGPSSSVMVCERGEVSYVVGLFLQSFRSCDEKSPSAYTLTSVHQEWIKSVIG